MPYIPTAERAALEAGARVQTPGELSYVITEAIKDFVGIRGGGYATYATVTGVLVLTLFEFVRRVVNPYEDIKKVRNGDVY